MKLNKNKFFSPVSTGLEEEYRNEKNAERMRRERFQYRFPKLSSFPLVNGTFGAIYCHGFSYVLVLLISIVVFTAIKIPHLHAPFTGQHSMKYNTYVEPAVYMDQKGTLLWNQKRYVSDSVHNPEGIFAKFEHLPLMDWGLLFTYRLFPDAGIEIKTRVFTNFIGVLILLSAYWFFCGYFPKSFTGLFIGLLSINPVFSFATFITVLDSIVLFFMFLSLRQICVVRNLIAFPKLALILILVLIIFLILVRHLLVRNEKFIHHLFEIVWGKKNILGLIIGVSIVVGILIFRYLRLYDFAGESLTDLNLVANYRLYKYMLFDQFKNYMTRNLFWFGLFGAALAFITRESAMRRIWMRQTAE